MISGKDSGVIRTPVIRKPIFLSQESRCRYELYKLQESYKPLYIKDIIKHYEMIVRRITHSSGFTAIVGKKKGDYKYFEEIYEICRIKGWDSKLFIEAQFKRLKGGNLFSVPRPYMFVSLNALQYFTNHLSTLKAMHQYDTNKKDKEKGKETVTLQKEVVDSIIKSIEILAMYIKQSRYEDVKQYKAMKIFQLWGELSPYYLYSIPWFKVILMNDLSGDHAESYKKEYEKIDHSKKLRGIISETVPLVERHYSIPENIILE